MRNAPVSEVVGPRDGDGDGDDSGDGSVEVPASLRLWFAVHAIVDIAVAVPLLLAPEELLPRLGWRAVDPVTLRFTSSGDARASVDLVVGVPAAPAKTEPPAAKTDPPAAGEVGQPVPEAVNLAAGDAAAPPAGEGPLPPPEQPANGVDVVDPAAAGDDDGSHPV